MAKTYSKIHQRRQAADSHMKKIQKRGGSVVKKEVPSGTKLEYSFRKKK